MRSPLQSTETSAALEITHPGRKDALASLRSWSWAFQEGENSASASRDAALAACRISLQGAWGM